MALPPTLPTANSKRTRSQTTLDGFFGHVDLSTSPLKQARIAVKHAAAPHPDPDPASSDKGSTTPPPLDNLLKRPSSPAKDAALLNARDSKRLRHERLFPTQPVSRPLDYPSSHNSPAMLKLYQEIGYGLKRK